MHAGLDRNRQSNRALEHINWGTPVWPYEYEGMVRLTGRLGEALFSAMHRSLQVARKRSETKLLNNTREVRTPLDLFVAALPIQATRYQNVYRAEQDVPHGQLWPES